MIYSLKLGRDTGLVVGNVKDRFSPYTAQLVYISTTVESNASQSATDMFVLKGI